MKKERKPVKFFYWIEKDGKIRFQIDYNFGFCDTGVVDTYDEIEEISKKIGIKPEKIED